MTELSFLVDLLLNHRLPKPTREAVAARIKEVEKGMGNPLTGITATPAFQARPIVAPAAIPAHMVGQPASTVAAMMRQEAAGAPQAIQSNHVSEIPPPAPVAVIAQTPQTAAALADRNAAIAQAISGKPEKGRTSPRKF